MVELIAPVKFIAPVFDLVTSKGFAVPLVTVPVTSTWPVPEFEMELVFAAAKLLAPTPVLMMEFAVTVLVKETPPVVF